MFDGLFYWTGVVIWIFLIFGISFAILVFIWDKLPKRLRTFLKNLFTFPMAMWQKIGEGKSRKTQMDIINTTLEQGTWEKRIFAKWWKWWFELRIRKGWTRTKKKK
jgi:hypothetical protein